MKASSSTTLDNFKKERHEIFTQWFWVSPALFLPKSSQNLISITAEAPCWFEWRYSLLKVGLSPTSELKKHA